MANEISSPNSRGGLATAVGLFIQDQSTARRTMILTDIDRGYRQALRRFDWPQAIRWYEAAVSLSTSDAFMSLPKDVGNVIRVVNTTVPGVMQETEISSQIDNTAGFLAIAGLPYNIARVGDSAVNRTLSPSTALEVVSDGTDVRTGFVEGILSGQTKRQGFTLTSAVAVAVGNWDEVTAVYVTSTSTIRTVSIRIVAGSTVIGTIAPSELRSVQPRYRVWPVPSQITSLKVIYRYAPPMLNDETHEFIIPIVDYLFEWAVGKSLESRRQFGPGAQHLQQAEMVLNQIWLDSRGHRTEQWAPISPYASYDNMFYTPVLGAWY